MAGDVRGVPTCRDEIVAVAGFSLQGHGTGAAMELKMLVRCDIGHDFIAVDGPALGASFTMREDFVGEIEHGFAIDAAHEIGGVGRCHIRRTSARLSP